MAEHAGILSSSPAPAVPEANQMADLPDDAMLLVLSRLPLDDLIQCRLVCKRLARLALHPDAWRRRRLTNACNSCNPCPLFSAGLRLGSCVDSMRIELPPETGCHLLFTSPCAARRLTISTVHGGAGSWQAALLVRHQGLLGRLREVDLTLYSPCPCDAKSAVKADVSVLLGTLASTPGLEKLTIKGDEDDPKRPMQNGVSCLHVTVPPSLTHFTCRPRDSRLEPAVNALLAAHAATLEEVEIVSLKAWPPSSRMGLVLAKLLRLAKLECQMLPDMEAVAACESLRELTLIVDDEVSPACRESIAAFFRRAVQLREVHFTWCHVHADCLDFVAALASSGRSRVETLGIYSVSRSPEPAELQVLLAALRSLPALRRLRVNAERDSDEAKALLEALPSLDVDLGQDIHGDS
ncbi:uncharacterized protein LOC113214238 [Frankliniella occidentalis]|uniref:Uncharacterized protein LOC113214238 n=1 Tax=Frankliniella occidentalis TaxID=133901 RepID=A0A6J1T7T0_FRAOC|nr:uncharacterized protein LOC113214238 [Frankliniella occidentalis]